MTMQVQIDQARQALVDAESKPNVMATLGAAALAAAAAVLLAGLMILGPGVAIEDQPVAVNATI